METITMPLAEAGSRYGVRLYKNEETGLMYFKPVVSRNLIAECPDGRTAFASINVHEHIVVCRLPANLEKEGEEPLSRFRVYVRESRKWLENPEIVRMLDPAQKKSKRKMYNFFEVLEVQAEYIHIGCAHDCFQNRVYVFRHKQWISVPYADMGFPRPVIHFKEIKKISFGTKEALLLTSEKRAMNPFSLYFLKSLAGGYLSISSPPGFQEKYRTSCVIFRHIFQKYVVIAIGEGLGLSARSFYVWRPDTGAFFPSAIPDGLPGKEVELKFDHEYFTEEHLLVKTDSEWIPRENSEHREAIFKVISTETWLPIEPTIVHTETMPTAVRPEIQDGKLTVSFPVSVIVKKTF
ncbi:MAG: hypothetical protein WDN09_01250 [bacterium]